MKSSSNINKSKKIGIIVYARMSSKRFPGKVLNTIINNQNLLEIIIESLKKNKNYKNIIIATSKNKIDDKIENFCIKNKVSIIRGDHQNVYSRTVKCIKLKKLDYIVRVCADRPFFDTTIMNKMIQIILRDEYDIVTNVFPITFPKGLTCEVANSKIFLETKSSILNSKEKEHIFNYFYKKKNFKIFNLDLNLKRKFIDQNFCIDNTRDIKRIKKIILDFKKKRKNINLKNLQSYYEK